MNKLVAWLIGKQSWTWILGKKITYFGVWRSRDSEIFRIQLFLKKTLGENNLRIFNANQTFSNFFN